MKSETELLILDTHSNGLPEYCEPWLEAGVCLREKMAGKCDKMHAYPPTWTDEDVLKHRQRIEQLIAYGSGSDSGSESGDDYNGAPAVRVLHKYVQDDCEKEDDVKLSPTEGQWTVVGTKRGHQSEEQARKKHHSPCPAHDMEIQPPVTNGMQQITFEFLDGEEPASINAALLQSRLPFLQQADTIVIEESSIRLSVEFPHTSRREFTIQAEKGTAGFSRSDLLRALSQLFDRTCGLRTEVETASGDDARVPNHDLRIKSVVYQASEQLCTVHFATWSAMIC